MWGALSDERTGLYLAVQSRKFNLKLHCDRRSVGQFILVPGPILISLFDNYLCITLPLSVVEPQSAHVATEFRMTKAWM
jgi:hypothetical protein